MNRRTATAMSASSEFDLSRAFLMLGTAAVALVLATGPAPAQVLSNPVEPRYDPIDRPAEGLGRNLPTTTTTWMWSSVIDEKPVVGSYGETLGEVEDVRRSPDGRYFAIIAFDEFLGLGGKLRSVPLTQMYYNGYSMVMPGASERWVDALPDYDAATAGFVETDREMLVPVRVVRTAGVFR